MKVHAYVADSGGCGHYRIIYPAGYLADSEDVDVHLFLEDSDASHLQVVCTDHVLTGYTSVLDVNPPDCDVVVLQRPLLRLLVDAIPHLQRQGVAVVVEVDDDFHAIHLKNIAYGTADPKNSTERNRDHLMRACRMADLVTTTTPALAARYGKHGRVAVLPNLLPDSFFDRPSVTSPWLKQRLWVGWSGSIVTHPTDLQETNGGVGRAMQTTDAGLYVVGSGVGVRENLTVRDEQPFVATGWTAIEDYPTAMAGMDIGIVPLDLTPFNEAKSYLKGMEMAALGIPFIASPTGEYAALAGKGAGLVASKGVKWYGILRALLTDDAFRVERAEAGRAAVEDMRYSRQSWRWADAWEQAITNHRLARHNKVRV